MLIKRRGLVALVSVALASTAIPAFADTIERALVQAYQNNPQVNAQRAALRATDENVPQALSGYRPRISATGSIGALYTDQKSIVSAPAAAGRAGAPSRGNPDGRRRKVSARR